MRLTTRQPLLPGVTGPVRTGRPTRSLLPRLEPGDIAVIDHLDLDRGTAQALLDAGVVAVVNAQQMISGRYANLGPELLAEAGVPLVEGIGGSAFARLAETEDARVHDGGVYAGEELIAQGRGLDAEAVRAAMGSARSGLVAQLETFAHNATELLRREQDVLLSGAGLPALEGRVEGGPVVVVSQAKVGELAGVKRFVQEQRPLVIAVGAAAERLRKSRIKADVVVVAEELPTAKVLRAASDVVVVERAGGTAPLEQLGRLGVAPHVVTTTVSAEDVALLTADAASPSVIVGVGLTATLADFLDSRRTGLAGAYLSRLVAGPRLVDARALPQLYTGKVRPWHLGAATVLGLAAVAVSVAATPVGQDWVDQLLGLL
ncbi:putative cytokinetic ring protein SteA [Nocardioides sp.]|uniref:putative cytokinetic ring protein SteA n=1 Tax=Nocardioides sp. TaxID=35761 RepID=UPI0039E53D94